MKIPRLFLFTTAALVAAGCGEVLTAPEGAELDGAGASPAGLSSGGGGGDRITICHFDDDTTNPDANGPGWELLEVNAKSAERHLAHGDALPGGYARGSDLDADCVASQVWAIAYTDVFEGDGPGFKSGRDLLIAKLVDDGDGEVGAGDRLTLGTYPLSLGAYLDRGTFGQTSHVATGAFVGGVTLFVFTATPPVSSQRWFEFAVTPRGESFAENEPGASVIPFFVFDDFASDGIDGIMTDPGALESQPQASVSEAVNVPGDQAHIDVEYNLPPS